MSLTAEIQSIICKMEVLRFNLPCENISYFYSGAENDVLSLNKGGYLTEFEVKISRSDFQADKKKKKWQHFENKRENTTPNYFYYVCPVGLIPIDAIPSYVGLIHIMDGTPVIIKKAPLIHKFKQNRERILAKFCRILTERKSLGGCRLTFENKKRRNK